MFEAKDQPKAKTKKSIIREYAEALIVAFCLALIIRTFIVQAFKIPSESMLETLLVGDQLLASKFAYGIKIPFTHKYIYIEAMTLSAEMSLYLNILKIPILIS